MKNRKFLLVTLLLVLVTCLLVGCQLKDHKQNNKIKKEYPFTVTLDYGGGVISAGGYTYMRYYCKSGALLKEPKTTEIVRTNYEVDYWFIVPADNSDAADGVKWNWGTDRVTADITLRIKWKPVRIFSIGYYDLNENGEKVWTQLSAVTKGIDGTEFVCGNLAGRYTLMNKRNGYTLLSGKNAEQPFYADENLTEPIDPAQFKHPITSLDQLEREEGSDDEYTNNVCKIFAKFLEGNWTLVDNGRNFQISNTNYYLLNDITVTMSDVTDSTTGEKIQRVKWNLEVEYSKIFEGNGHTVTFEGAIQSVTGKVAGTGVGLFGSLNGAEVRNVTFENVIIDFRPTTVSNLNLRVGLLAGSISNTKFENVKITGTLTIGETNGTKDKNELTLSEQKGWCGEMTNVVGTVDTSEVALIDERIKSEVQE